MTKWEQAVAYHHQGFNCCQAVTSSFAEELGLAPSLLFAAGEGFGSGMGSHKNTCGAVSGMVMALGLFHSAADPQNPRATKSATTRLAGSMTDRFLEENGSLICEVLKGRTGKAPVPCDTCIASAARILEEALAALKKP